MDEFEVCQLHAFIKPCYRCEEKNMETTEPNVRHPWPTDPAALTENQATTLTAVRFDFRRREREAI